MARKIRSSQLETRTNRLKLPAARKPAFVRIGPGISLGYRRNKTAGTWVLRIADGGGGAKTSAIGHADDFDEADGQNFLTFFQAQERAKSVVRTTSGGSILKPLTVGEAAANYLKVLSVRNAQTAYDTKLRLEKHFLKNFSEKPVANLSKTMLDNWLASMVVQSNNPDDIRKSKDLANRVLSMVKALLNHAMRDQSHGLKDHSPWRFVRPFNQVSKPRDIRYTDEEVLKLINSVNDPSLANLIKAAFLTGARYGEMMESLVSSVDFEAKRWTVRGKTGGKRSFYKRVLSSFSRQ